MTRNNNYRPGISPKDKNFFMSKKEEEQIKDITTVESEVDRQVETRKNIKATYNEQSSLNLDQLSEKDFQFIRGNMMTAIETGHEAINELMDLARSSGHPRAFEVLSLMLKTVMDGNKQLIDIHKDYKEMTTVEDETPQTVNNNLFVGTTSELHKLLKGIKDK